MVDVSPQKQSVKRGKNFMEEQRVEIFTTEGVKFTKQTLQNLVRHWNGRKASLVEGSISHTLPVTFGSFLGKCRIDLHIFSSFRVLCCCLRRQTKRIPFTSFQRQRFLFYMEWSSLRRIKFNLVHKIAFNPNHIEGYSSIAYILLRRKHETECRCYDTLTSRQLSICLDEPKFS